MKKGWLVYLCFFMTATHLPWAIKMASVLPNATLITALCVISACVLSCGVCCAVEIIKAIKRKNKD